jgi:hypothetical protein
VICSLATGLKADDPWTGPAVLPGGSYTAAQSHSSHLLTLYIMANVFSISELDVEAQIELRCG